MGDEQAATKPPLDRESPTSKPHSQSPTASPENSTTDRKALLEQARLFLRDDTISQAPLAEKKTFLRNKGLGEDEIQALLESGELDDSEAEQVTQVSPTTDPSSTTPLHSENMVSSTPATSPPIITYPEFLMHPSKPPLLPLSTLASTAYFLGAVSTLTYGANKYLVQPMLESLAHARHDLNQTTLQNLEKLNSQLASTVSHLPKEDKTTLFPHGETEDLGSDTSSEISDPTELFHRDVGIQTTPTLLRTPHHSGSSSPTPDTPESILTSQINSVNNLRFTLSTLLTLSQPTSASEEPPLLAALASTTQSLASLSLPVFPRSQIPKTASIIQTLPSPSAQDPSPADGPSRPTRLDPPLQYEQDDQAAIFRAEIRALKGAVLGAKKFPAPPPIAGIGMGVEEEAEVG